MLHHALRQFAFAFQDVHAMLAPQKIGFFD